MLCLRSRSKIRICAVLLGMLTGLGIASVWVVKTNEGFHMKDHPGMVKGIILKDVQFHSFLLEKQDTKNLFARDLEIFHFRN